MPRLTMHCLRNGCLHPRNGGVKEGHFGNGEGPCKVLGCLCRGFLVQEVRRRFFPAAAVA